MAFLNIKKINTPPLQAHCAAAASTSFPGFSPTRPNGAGDGQEREPGNEVECCVCLVCGSLHSLTVAITRSDSFSSKIC